MTLTPDQRRLLIEQAKAAAARAYAPYSRFAVGAAILGVDGVIYTGTNVENASFGATLCAERSALAQAVNAGCTAFQAVAIYTDTDTPTSPCGICRQSLMEFGPDLAVISVCKNDLQADWTLSQLLPDAFTPAHLSKKP
jgi:cytidine deaminase